MGPQMGWLEEAAPGVANCKGFGMGESRSGAVANFVLAPPQWNHPFSLFAKCHLKVSLIEPLRYSSLVEYMVSRRLRFGLDLPTQKMAGQSTAMTDSSGSEVHIVFLHLLIDDLALQPCNLGVFSETKF
ncbi:hypothetical protein B0H34DRAFT_195522 [Crassisporium funariophilum]|nr:hypothetical protein B0H34DRAFT_195522 [Crassisporium funariophilum]